MKRFWTQLVLLMTLAVLAACGSEGANKPPADVADAVEDTSLDLGEPEDGYSGDLTGAAVETVVDSEALALGESVKVSCEVTVDGDTVKVKTEVHVKPTVEEGAEEPETQTMGPGEWKPSKAGEYDVWCSVAGEEIADETPAHIIVTLAKIVKITTSVDPEEILAGDTAEVTCTGEDEDGNTDVINPGIKTDPADGVEIAEQVITGKIPGEYEVRCKAIGGPTVVPATLTVKLGPAVNFVAKVTPSTVGVGEPAQVDCDITDKAGNKVDVEWKIEAPDALTVTGKSVSTTKAGKHKIKCLPVAAEGGEKYTEAELVVEPGEIVGMKVYIKPVKEFFAIGDVITVAHDLVDIYDNVVESAEIEPIDASPAENLDLQPNKNDKFKLLDDGVYTFKVKAISYPYSGEATAICDTYGPVITFTHPPRAFTTTAGANLVVTGNVKDRITTVESLEINGETVAVDPSGNFTAQMALTHGMNMLSAKAVDGHGKERNSFRSIFRSSEFKPAELTNPAAAAIPRGLRVWLSQDFIDDGDHSLPADDLATIIEIVAENMDLASLIPAEGIPFAGQCTAEIKEVTYGKPQVTMQSVDLGLRLILELPDLFAELNIECCYNVPYVGLCCDPYYGFITADAILLDAFLFVRLDENKKVVAELGPVEVELDGVNIDLQGLQGPMFDALVNLLITTFKDTAVESLTSSLGESIPQMVADAMASLEQGIDFEVPALIGSGPPTPLKIGVQFEELLCSYDGISIEVNASVLAPKTITHQPLGVLMRDNCLGTEATPFQMPKQLELSLALAADLLNEALYSIWNGGAITLNLTAADLASLDVTQYGIENLEIATDLNYAPFIQTCGTGTKLMLQLGDAFIHAKFFMMNMNWDIQMYLFLALDVDVQVGLDEEGNTAIMIVLGDFQVAEVEITEVGSEIRGKEGIVVSLFKDTLLGEIKKSLGEGIAFALPSIDLSSLSDQIPEGISINIEPQKVGLDTGFLVIGGKLK